MKAVQLVTGDFVTHYLIGDEQAWRRDISMQPGSSPERFELCEVEDPVPKAGEVLVEIWACGLNHLEVWATGTLKSVVDKVFPLSQIREAVAYLADRRQLGKVVAVPDGEGTE